MSEQFYYSRSLPSLKLKSSGRQADAENLIRLYSKAWKCIRSYEASFEPYFRVQQHLNTFLQGCQDEQLAKRKMKQMSRNGLFMLQTFLHIEKGHRYAPDDDDCKNYGIVRNAKDTAYSSFSKGYTGHSFDDFNVREARDNPMLRSLRTGSRETVQGNMDQISAHNKDIFDRVQDLKFHSSYGSFVIDANEVRIGPFCPPIGQNSPTLWISEEKISVPEWTSSQYEMFFADEATAQELLVDKKNARIKSNGGSTPAQARLKEKLYVRHPEEKPRPKTIAQKPTKSDASTAVCKQPNAANIEGKAKAKRRRIIDDDDESE